MKVKELIEQLSKLPEELIVYAQDGSYASDWMEVNDVVADFDVRKGPHIKLETE